MIRASLCVVKRGPSWHNPPFMRRVCLWVLLAPLVLGCGEDERLIQGALGTGGAAGAGGTGGAAPNATFSTRGSVEQVFVTHAKPGSTLSLHDSSDAEIQSAKADTLGSLVFRHVPPGADYPLWGGVSTGCTRLSYAR